MGCGPGAANASFRCSRSSVQSRTCLGLGSGLCLCFVRGLTDWQLAGTRKVTRFRSRPRSRDVRPVAVADNQERRLEIGWQEGKERESFLSVCVCGCGCLGVCLVRDRRESEVDSEQSKAADSTEYSSRWCVQWRRAGGKQQISPSPKQAWRIRPCLFFFLFSRQNNLMTLICHGRKDPRTIATCQLPV